MRPFPSSLPTLWSFGVLWRSRPESFRPARAFRGVAQAVVVVGFSPFRRCLVTIKTPASGGRRPGTCYYGPPWRGGRGASSPRPSSAAVGAGKYLEQTC